MTSEVIPKLLDHRYFYNDWTQNGYVGNYTCGLVRNAVAEELHANEWNFADTDFLKSLPDYINNPCVAGFMIEQAVLSSIRSNGLAIGTGINKPMTMVMFESKFPKFQTDKIGTPVLYCPRQFNFRGVDGIIVRIAPEGKSPKRKLSMFPLQITLAPGTHSDSHEAFFGQYKQWIGGLENFDVVPEFLWITPDPPSLKSHRKNKERYVHLKDVSRDIWNQYEKATRNKRIQLSGREELRKCSKCKAEEPLSAFATAGAKTRYLKTCLECRTSKKTAKSW